MRAAIIFNGTVENVLALPDNMTIDADGKAARGPSSYVTKNMETDESEETSYEAVYEAPDGRILVASDTAGPGWTWSETDGFKSPEPAAPQPKTSFTPNEFLGLFTAPEKAAIFASDDPQVRMFLFMASGAPVIALDNPETIAGLDVLTSQKLLTAERVTQIRAGSAANA